MISPLFTSTLLKNRQSNSKDSAFACTLTRKDRLLDEHLAEMPHLDPKTMSPSEKQYHLFLAHDYNQDLNLDGVEIMQSIFHDDSTELYTDEVLAQKIDYLLDNFDRNRDGKLSFPEFMMSDARFTAV
ncbi:putative multiple coagulation factor deficiency protein 2-like isoform X1 [Penaeus vannamei]|uniref:Putative multiple coagulation factor deficiency protein 2-like isoform X1 n=1 Tax=Penaeus vannamei TaxID=6689 RepID=A0A3R7PKH0_PENVA|nr:putative multiple coagulation factor deficiency protein 2-like isoform X1 [Penaeus vannamei]